MLVSPYICSNVGHRTCGEVQTAMIASVRNSMVDPSVLTNVVFVMSIHNKT